MDPKIQIDLSDIQGENISFWSAGNHPTQMMYGLSSSIVLMHLKALYLLCDKVLAAASYYFESDITREVTDQLRILFERGEVLYFIDASMENFAEHGTKKAKKSPAGLICYKDKTLVHDRAKSLDSIGYILRRPSYSISDKIVELWIKDVLSKCAGTIGGYLSLIGKGESRLLSLKTQLIDIAKSRNKDFVWEYLKPKLKQLRLSEDFLRAAQKRLSQMYSIATSELLGAPLDRREPALSPYITTHSHFDTSLFLNCMDVLGVTKYLTELSSVDLITLKNSQEFILFRLFYFTLIDALAYQPREVNTWLPIYKETALHYPISEIKIEDFIQSFKDLCRSTNKPQRQYRRPLDVLLYTYNLSRRLLIEEFVDKIRLLTKKSISTPFIFHSKSTKLENARLITILFLTASPLDEGCLRLSEEIRTIDEKLRQAEYGNNFEIKQHHAVRIKDIQGTLLRHNPHIVHFSGHGGQSSEIVLESPFGTSQEVPISALSNLFATLKDNIQCVVLNACYSEKQARAIVKHIDCVIGMSEDIEDSTAISFSAGFYQALAYGKDIKTAFDLGRGQINLENLTEENIPKLFVKKGVNPKDIIFVRRP